MLCKKILYGAWLEQVWTWRSTQPLCWPGMGKQCGVGQFRNHQRILCLKLILFWVLPPWKNCLEDVSHRDSLWDWYHPHHMSPQLRLKWSCWWKPQIRMWNYLQILALWKSKYAQSVTLQFSLVWLWFTIYEASIQTLGVMCVKSVVQVLTPQRIWVHMSPWFIETQKLSIIFVCIAPCPELACVIMYSFIQIGRDALCARNLFLQSKLWISTCYFIKIEQSLSVTVVIENSLLYLLWYCMFMANMGRDMFVTSVKPALILSGGCIVHDNIYFCCEILFLFLSIWMFTTLDTLSVLLRISIVSFVAKKMPCWTLYGFLYCSR